MLAILVTAVAAAAGVRNGWAMLCVAIAALGTIAVVDNFVRSLLARRRSTGEAWLRAAILLVDRNHRRYGGQLAHLGLMMIVVGIVLWLFISRTRFGMIIRAGVDDRDMVSATGINVRVVFAAVFFIGSALA